MSNKTIAVIGGGSAGFTAARVAHELGAHVLFFMGDNADHASLCVNAGCMPSKALFEPIDAMHHAKRNGWFDVKPRNPESYLAELVQWKDREIEAFRVDRQEGINRMAGERFEIIRANARFRNEHELESSGKNYRFDAAIIASGSVMRWPEISGIEELRGAVWTSDEILHNTKVPASLTVIGAGAIGLEFSLRYARLGSRVTLVSSSNLLPRYPAIFGERLAKIYEEECIRLLVGTRVQRLRRNNDGLFEADLEGAAGSETLHSERVLIATGRRAAIDSLNLPAAGVTIAENGSIEVGENMRVLGSSHIFAAGDVAGKRMIVHHAHIEGGIAANNAVSESDEKWTRCSNVQVIFSDPEFAYAGAKPRDLEESGREIVRAAVDSSDVGKLHLAGDDLGVGEFAASVAEGKLVSAGLLCNDASNLIHLPAYAIDHEHTVYQLAEAEYYHPTKIELVSSIADALCRRLGGHPKYERAPE